MCNIIVFNNAVIYIHYIIVHAIYEMRIYVHTNNVLDFKPILLKFQLIFQIARNCCMPADKTIEKKSMKLIFTTK